MRQVVNEAIGMVPIFMIIQKTRAIYRGDKTKIRSAGL